MNVLSLFDGMSCGQIALKRLGLNVNKYYASEIDKYAMIISKKNFPDTIYLGDVTKVKGDKLDKIDLLIGGSPCQGFSFAGKQLNFDDPRSKLFFEYVRLLNECKPKYFLLENVMMKQEYQDVISKELGVIPIKINSSLVSAQNRVRLYWTNIPNVTQPVDKQIYLKDILLPLVDDKYFLTDKLVKGFLNKKSAFGDRFKPLINDKKSGCLTARYFKMGSSDPYILEPADKYIIDRKYFKGHILDKLFTRCKKDINKVISNKPIQLGAVTKSMGTRVYHENGKSVCLSALGGGWGAKTGLYHDDYCIRRLTPIECERLQNVDDNYTQGVSDTQRYKMLGNGWTIDVITHIFGGL